MGQRSLVSSVLCVVTIASLVEAAPAWTEVTFQAPVPCAVACPEWLALLNFSLDGNGEGVYFEPCENPGGSRMLLPNLWFEGTAYDDVWTEPIPRAATMLTFELFENVRANAFICEEQDTFDGDGVPGEMLARGPAFFEERCGPLGSNNPFPIGCAHIVDLPLAQDKAGRVVVLRVFNWSDSGSIRGRYAFNT